MTYFQTIRTKAFCVAFGLMTLAIRLPECAASIVNGGTLLSQADADQLEDWLGEGLIEITNIYSKAAGHTAADFHAAVDGKGRTFTLIEIDGNPLIGTYAYTTNYGSYYANVPTQIIGGYNPQSWASNVGYNYTPSDADRTAFIFNLTSGEIQRQNLSSEPGSGVYQTYNALTVGPTFGGSHDIYVSQDLSYASTYNVSYGGFRSTNDIVSGSTLYGPEYDVGDTAYLTSGLRVSRLEVFSIAPITAGPVPELASLATWSLLAFATSLGALRRREPILSNAV